jgi:hypothetical protein
MPPSSVLQLSDLPRIRLPHLRLVSLRYAYSLAPVGHAASHRQARVSPPSLTTTSNPKVGDNW